MVLKLIPNNLLYSFSEFVDTCIEKDKDADIDFYICPGNFGTKDKWDQYYKLRETELGSNIIIFPGPKDHHDDINTEEPYILLGGNEVYDHTVLCIRGGTENFNEKGYTPIHHKEEVSAEEWVEIAAVIQETSPDVIITYEAPAQLEEIFYHAPKDNETIQQLGFIYDEYEPRIWIYNSMADNRIFLHKNTWFISMNHTSQIVELDPSQRLQDD